MSSSFKTPANISAWLTPSSSSKPIRLVGVHDAITARLASAARPNGLWLGSLSLSLSVGVPDEGFVDTQDYCDRLKAIRRVSSLPILVDVDAGCLRTRSVGDVLSLLHTAGANGVAIEDKIEPKVNSFARAQQRLRPTTEFVELLSSAVKSKPARNFAIIARTDALVAGSSTQEALERLSSYEHGGIDGVLIQSIAPDPSQLLNLLQIISMRTKIGVVGTIPTAYPQITADQWKEFGASLIVYSNQLLRASIPPIEKAASALADDTAGRLEPQIASVSRLLELMNN